MVNKLFLYTTCQAGQQGSSQAHVVGSSAADDGPISCASFAFTPLTSNMMEAGVSGINLVRITNTGQTVITPIRTLFIGFPNSTVATGDYTAADAANITAKGMNAAGQKLADDYKNYNDLQMAAVTRGELETKFMNYAKIYISTEINAGVTIGVQKNGQSTVVQPVKTNNPIEQLLNGITGNKC